MGRYDDPGEQADEEEERSTWDTFESDQDNSSDDDNDADGIGDDGMDD